jgi:Cu/Ag efflux protein CusF
MAFLLACVVGLGLTGQAFAQEKAKGMAEAPKVERLSGTVHIINRDTNKITLRASGNAMRQVVYSETTKFTKLNRPGGTLDEIKEGTRVICLGKYDEKNRLMAARIDIRLPK